MVKKIIYILIFVILILGGAYLAYRFYGHQEKKVQGALELVPEDAALILQTQDFQKFSEQLIHKNNFWNDLDSIPAFNKVNKNVKEILSTIQKNEQFKNALKTIPVVISAHAVGKNDFSLLYYIKPTVDITEAQINEFFASNKVKKQSIAERNYDSHKIFELKQSDKVELFYVFVNNVLVVSRSSLLVEAVIRQSGTKYNLLEKESFKEVNKTAGKNVLANLYVNLKSFSSFASICFKSPHNSNVKSLYIGDWCEMDLNIKESTIMLNGFMNSNDSIFRYINIFKHQESVETEMEEVIPSGTVSFVHLGISDIQKFQADYNKYLADAGLLNDNKKTLDAIKQKYGFDLNTLLYSLFEDELAIAYEQPQSDNVNDDAVVIMKTVSQRLSREELLKLLQKHASVHGNDFETYIYNYQVDQETTFPIYTMPFPKIVQLAFGKLFESVSASYFTFFDNYLVFASSKKTLIKFILDNVRNQTLDKEMNYMNFKDNLSARSNFYFYSQIAPANQLFSHFFESGLADSFNKNINSFRKINCMGLQFTGNNNLLYNSIVLYYNSDVREKPHTVWETNLDTTILFKPKLVINHRTTQKEIFVQDLNNNIYLINASGRILWKVHLKDKIMSDIYQVDAYKNNKLQYLFNTKHQIYLVDINGNNVEHFPLEMRSPATNGIAVFDYDNSRDYRIFVAGEDKHVYLYDLTGNILPGWTFGQTDNEVTLPVQHFRIDETDYIVFADSLKTFILNRRGEEKVKVSKYFSKSKNNPFYLFNPYGHIEGNYLVTTDRVGKIYYIAFDGSVSVKEIGDFTPEHYFALEDIDRNGKPDYLFVEENKLTAYNENKEEMFSNTFDNNIKTEPILFTFPNNVCKIGVCDALSEKVYLFNADGSVYKDFPLEGKSPYSIGHFDDSSLRFNLIVGGKGNFLYNYAVN